MGCFSSKPAVASQPLTPAATETQVAPISRAQQVPKAQPILRAKPIPKAEPIALALPIPKHKPIPKDQPASAPTQTFPATSPTRSTPGSPPSLPTLPSPQKNLPSPPNLHSSPARPAFPREHHHPPSHQHEDTLVEPIHADTPPTSIPIHAPTVDENDITAQKEASNPVVPQLDGLTSHAEQSSTTTATPVSHQYVDINPNSYRDVKDTSTQPPAVTSSETQPEFREDPTHIRAVHETLQTKDSDLVLEADPSTKQDSAAEEVAASHDLDTTDETYVDLNNTATLDLPTQLLRDEVHVQPLPATSAQPISANAALHDTVAATDEANQQNSPVTSEGVLSVRECAITGERAYAITDDIEPALVTKESLSSLPEVDGRTANPYARPSSLRNKEDGDTLVPPVDAIDKRPIPVESVNNTISAPEQSLNPVAVHLDNLTSASLEESLTTATSFPHQHDDIATISDGDVNYSSAQPLPVAPEKTKPDDSHGATRVVAEQETLRLQDNNSLPESDSSIKQDSATAEATASHDPDTADEIYIDPDAPVAPHLSTKPLRDHMRAQSTTATVLQPIPANATALHDTLANEEPNREKSILEFDEDTTAEQHDITAKSAYVVPDDIKAGAVTEGSFASQREADSRIATPRERPHVHSGVDSLSTRTQASAVDIPPIPVANIGHVLSVPEETDNRVAHHLNSLTAAISEQSLTDEPNEQNLRSTSNEEPTAGEHDITAKSASVVPDDIKPAFATDDSLASPPEVDSSTNTLFEHPPVYFSREEGDSFAQPSIVGKSGTSVASDKTFSGLEESSHPVVAQLDSLTASSTEVFSTTGTSLPVAPFAADRSSNSEDSLIFHESPARTPSQVSSDRTLGNEGDTSFSPVADVEENTSAQSSTFDENDVIHSTGTPSTYGEDIESAASTSGFGRSSERSSTSSDQSVQSSVSTDAPQETFKRGGERSFSQSIQSTWDYKTPYRGGCDAWVMNNPPHGVGYYSFQNYHGKIGTNLRGGAYHYQNIGTDGGFYVRNSDGSSYHYSPARGGTYKEPY